MFWGGKCSVFEVHPKLLAAVDVAWPTFQLHAPLDWSIKAVAFCLFKLMLKKKGVPGRSLQKEKNTEYLDIGDVFGCWCTHGMLCFEISNTFPDFRFSKHGKRISVKERYFNSIFVNFVKCFYIMWKKLFAFYKNMFQVILLTSFYVLMSTGQKHQVQNKFFFI